MRRIDIFVSVLIVFLIVLGMFFGYGLGEENKPPQIRVKQQEEASVSSPIEPDQDDEETQGQDTEETQDQNDKKTIKGGDNGVFKLGGSEIKLMLVQPQPLFSTELFSESEEEN